jgi:hypothetical protein
MRQFATATLCSLVALLTLPLCAQDLAPRAYLITPVNFNAVLLTWSFYDGGVDFNGTIPVTCATGTFSIPIFSIYHSLSFFGRSANLTASLPYGVETFQGNLVGQHQQIYRSGLVDFTARLSVNLLGGPAMKPQQFAKWKQKTILRASLKIIAPTGQYDPTQLINWGINRWAFKPEFGYSERWGNCVLDGYIGVWFYTTNPASYAGAHPPLPQTEDPIGSLEGHLSRDFKWGTWASSDGNFWWGGLTALSGIKNLKTEQTSSRIGATGAWRFASHQQVKVSYNYWHLYAVRRQLPEPASWVAVLMARLAKVDVCEKMTNTRYLSQMTVTSNLPLQ